MNRNSLNLVLIIVTFRQVVCLYVFFFIFLVLSFTSMSEIEEDHEEKITKIL